MKLALLLLAFASCTTPELSSVAESVRLETGGGTFNGDGKTGYRETDLNGNTTFASISFAPFAFLGLDRERRSQREFVEAIYARQMANIDDSDETPPPSSATPPLMGADKPADREAAVGTEGVSHWLGWVWATCAAIVLAGLAIAWNHAATRARVRSRMECQ